MKTIRFFAPLAAITLAMIAPNAGSAQTTTTETTMHACYVPKTGTVYRIKVTGTPVKCSPNHVEFSWTAGSGALPAPQVIVTASTPPAIDAGAEIGMDVTCPAGTTMLTGGFGTADDLMLKGSLPLPNMGWRFVFKNPTALPATVYLNAACLRLQ
jgi:hypothetical protein